MCDEIIGASERELVQILLRNNVIEDEIDN